MTSRHSQCSAVRATPLLGIDGNCSALLVLFHPGGARASLEKCFTLPHLLVIDIKVFHPPSQPSQKSVLSGQNSLRYFDVLGIGGKTVITGWLLVGSPTLAMMSLASSPFHILIL